MLSRALLFAVCVWGVAFGQSAPTVQSDQSYAEVLVRVRQAQQNVTLLVSSPDPALVDALEAAAQVVRSGGIMNKPGNLYLIRGSVAAPREADLVRAGVEVRTFGQDFPQSLVVVDFKTIMAANLPDPELAPPLSEVTWEIVDFDAPAYTVVADLASYWQQAQVPR